MQVKPGLDPIEVPAIAEKAFAKWWEEIRDPKETSPFDPEEDWDDVFWEWASECLHDSIGKIVPKELAKFLIDYHLSSVPGEGGYNFSDSMEVGDIEVVCFGWANEGVDSYMIGFKK